MHSEDLQAKLVEVFGEEAGKVIGFLEKGRFSEGGEAAIAKTFFDARVQGRLWRKLSPSATWSGRKTGVNNPSPSEVILARQAMSAGQIKMPLPGLRRRLVITKRSRVVSPLAAGDGEVSKSPTVVKTANSVYTLGQADDKGVREIRKGDKVLFPAGVVVFLREKFRMELHSSGVKPVQRVKTSPVESTSPA